MTTIFAILFFLVGLLAVIKGANYFVDASDWFSDVTGISRLIVGATIVSVATTLPELLVSITATVSGNIGIATGNALGSAACNLGLVMGIATLVMPSRIRRVDIFDKGLLLIVSSIVSALLIAGGIITVPEAGMLFALLGIFFYININATLKKGKKIADSIGMQKKMQSASVNIIKFAVGTLLIVIGARMIVDGAEQIATLFNIEETIIGFTVVALGTSIPELITALKAISKKKFRLFVGNIIGATIINLTLILPSCALISMPGLEIGTELATVVAYAIILLAAIAIVPTLILKRFSRIQGIALIGIYLSLIIYLPQI